MLAGEVLGLVHQPGTVPPHLCVCAGGWGGGGVTVREGRRGGGKGREEGQGRERKGRREGGKGTVMRVRVRSGVEKHVHPLTSIPRLPFDWSVDRSGAGL